MRLKSTILTTVLRQVKQTLASAAHMNRLMPLLITRLKNDGLSTIEHDAVTTAHTRYRLGILWRATTATDTTSPAIGPSLRAKISCS